MANLTTKSTSHRYLSYFVEWIRPPDTTVDAIEKQADEIRTRISGKAKDDNLVVQAMPWSGSYAKRTGLRRHMLGDCDIEGQDVDLAFIVSPETKRGESIDTLLDRFEKYAQASYPNTSRSPTRSSVRLDFAGTKLSYDLVPLRAVSSDAETQVLIRRDGEERSTSIQKHIAFVKNRTAKSNDLPGRVKFNEVVRLVKWMREARQSTSEVLPEVPTIVIDLLCARAFDDHGVSETYTETLHMWFGKIAHIARGRKRVDFTDFIDPSGSKVVADWLILDPTNANNNVVPRGWKNLQLQEFATWFEDARDGMARVVAADVQGRDSAIVTELTEIFGAAFANHKEAP